MQDASGPSPRPANDDVRELRLAAEVARRFYLQDLSKVEIAAQLGLSRFKVARLLERAREEGIVRIQVAEPEVDARLSAVLSAALKVPRVLVLDSVDVALRTEQVGALAASYVHDVLKPGDYLGLAWSRSTQSFAEELKPVKSCTVVQMCGVLAHTVGEEQSVELVRRAASNLGARALAFYAPLIVPDATTAKTLRRQPGIADALRCCDRLSVAVIAIGEWREDCSTVHDYLAPREQAQFAKRGAVAESAGILFDARGRLLPDGLQDRTIAISAAQLRRAGEVIALATDAERSAAIRAITASGLVTTLVTHRQAAEQVLRDLRA